MSQPTLPEPSNNHRPETELPSFVKRGNLWVPETVQRRSLQRFWHWTGFSEKKLWDVLQLLMPLIVVLIGTISFQWAMKERDLQIASNRVNQETLIRYFDQTASLLFDHSLRTSQVGDEARIVARARTLAALRELDGQRKKLLVKFLVEAKLVNGENLVINLSNADFSEANLGGVDLHGAIITWANFDKANLGDIDLRKANLLHTSFNETQLGGAKFGAANLTETKFYKAVLRGSVLDGANLTQSVLDYASLRGASLKGAFFNQASFTHTDLTGAKFSSDALDSAYLCQTTMPNGKMSDRDCDKLKQPK